MLPLLYGACCPGRFPIRRIFASRAAWRPPSNVSAPIPAWSDARTRRGRSPVTGSFRKSPEQQARVRSSESERVGKGVPDLLLARLVGHIVQIAFGVGRRVVDRRGNDPVVDRQDGEDPLDGSGRAEEMSGHRL